MSLRSGKYVNTGLHILLFSLSNYSVFYEDWSFMMDEERSSMIPTMAAGKTFSKMLLFFKKHSKMEFLNVISVLYLFLVVGSFSHALFCLYGECVSDAHSG